MSDVHWIFIILLFWVIYLPLATAWANDEVLGLRFGTGQINTTETWDRYNESLTVTLVETSSGSYLSTMFQLFAFRLQSVSPVIAILISSVNWVLLSVSSILIYRLIRSGGG